MRASGANLDAIRRHNLGMVLRHLHERGPATRAELTSMTGLNRSTVAGLVDDLVARGVVSLGEAVSSGAPGRPSPLVSPRGDRVVVLALDIAVDSLAAAAVGIGGQVHARTRLDRPRDPAQPSTTVATVAGLGLDMLDQVGGAPHLLGIGVSVVGVVRPSDGHLRVAPNLGWHDVPLPELVLEHLGTRAPVHVGNDGDLGALAEHRRGAGVGHDSMLYLSGEVGIGGGLVVDGRPLAGSGGSAGEVGHMLVNPRGRDCRCGAAGCWETEAGEVALLRRAHRADDAGPEALPAVLADAAAGGPRARRAVEDTARWLGTGIGSLANVLDPERIVLGSLFATLHGLAADVITDAASRQALSNRLDIVPAVLGDDAPLLGAAERAFEAALLDPTILPAIDLAPETR